MGVDVEMHAWDAVTWDAQALGHEGANRPVVVVLDDEIRADVADGIRRLLRRGDLRLAVVVPVEGEPWWGALLEHPAVDLITEASSLRELVEAVERFAAGERILLPERRRELFWAWTQALDNHRHTVSLVQTLSPQQLRVLQLLASGHRVREIAQLLGVADGTVRSHVRTLRAKLGAKSQIEAVAMLRHMEGSAPVPPRPRSASDPRSGGR
ncbi:MAG TPA: LuxR C-terminal-related transcriptional regulator [Nocardioides sp.]|nr:LuxR C-terminal-related transcriptional regulator [Nocardioides sp.]